MGMKFVVEVDVIDGLWRGITKEPMWYVNDMIAAGDLKDDCEVRVVAGEDSGWQSERRTWKLVKTFGDENGEKWTLWKKDGNVCLVYEHEEYDDWR